jgi:sec-independent protein translocase protein TatB
MFDIGWTELVIVGIVALIVIGPRELPKTLRTIGQMMTKVRRMASEFQNQFNDAIREAELDELRKEAEKLSGIGDPLGNFDPLGKVKSEIESAVEGTEKPTAEAAPAPAQADAALEPAETPATSESAAAPQPETPESGGGRAA